MRIVVAGLANVEMNVRISGFPLAYNPVNYPFFGIRHNVSGVGYNVARALTTLGDEVAFLTLVGPDLAGQQVRSQLAADGIGTSGVLDGATATANSVILYDGDGRRQIHVDLKDIQERAYPGDVFARALASCDLAVLGNVNFTRRYLPLAREMGKRIATDVHTIDDLDDPYNRDYMAAADILFMSDERLPAPPEQWARRVLDRYEPELLVIGLGRQGALLAVRATGRITHLPAVAVRPVVNTIGAGDALFASFIHRYARTGDPEGALREAILFAGYKIGAVAAADGFLTRDELAQLVARSRGGN